MNSKDPEHQQFLEQQLNWCKEQDDILEAIEVKLHEMRDIVMYALGYELTAFDTRDLNRRLNELKYEVDFLETHLRPVNH
ncbi:hypothetical protein [Bacillus sp. CGMCC 1.16541]|uniref:hypothetical protein n=1 Tax=Bacillus sp. CGMCC 1.16541 TaxID=2185143 RepID=UPI000D72C17D|nr:hypothetical protein [Bacillus sp. CGMCC 1.16541]